MFRTAQALPFAQLRPAFDGDLYFDESPEHSAQRKLYATDASVYQEMPIAVALPKTVEDIKRLVRFAKQHNRPETTIGLIPRAAGTSLAGQVVGNGIVVDISTYFDKIIELNVAERWVRVQPGVIRDDLNAFLRPHGLMFGPETSTASRAMIGGMIGNNSCGLHSIVWGSTRDHLLEVRAILTDGAEVTFGPLTAEQFEAKCNGQHVVSPLEQQLYAQTRTWLSDPKTRRHIRDTFPKPTVTRRNTGYALDALLDFWEEGVEGGRGVEGRVTFPPSSLSSPSSPYNFCHLLAGSEGTLAFVTEAKLNVLPLPPAEIALVCAHFDTVQGSLQANLIALAHGCQASELVDDYILELTKTNTEQLKNRTFVVGEPKTVLMVEFFDHDHAGVARQATQFVEALQAAGLGYAYPTLFNDDTKKPWALRKAGLGILYNLPGDDLPVNLIEDCAVSPEDLPSYIAELETLARDKYELRLQYSAHVGAGELHVLVLMNLKTTTGRQKFRNLLADTALLVKKYNGSLSGEHGDGRLRGEFIPLMVGPETFALMRQVKQLWDPTGIFNPGKIVDTPPMNESLRTEADQLIPQPQTIFDFSKEGGLLHLAEKCSGSGDCRKTHLSGGTMCPSYMATRRERDTTRARANILRQFYSQTTAPNTHSLTEVKDVLDLCLSCKACQSECPSSVDMTRMKAEFTQQLYRQQVVPFRARLVGNFTKLMQVASLAPRVYNGIFGTPALRRIANQLVGFHPDRTMPELNLNATFHISHFSKLDFDLNLFLDEFTRYNDGSVGQKAMELLQRLGYNVHLPDHVESGRTYLSKGLVADAQKIAIKNVTRLRPLVSEDRPLVGLEPSAILTFRDEYPDLVPAELKADAQHIARHTFLFEEWLAREVAAGRVSSNSFTTEPRHIKIHGHCHQKALSTMQPVLDVLTLPKNYRAELIPSGCCGMAGSFGYEKEHYELSMQIGELVLFPAVRGADAETIIAAPGTSCRHQIKDGTGRHAQHPAEILFNALI